MDTKTNLQNNSPRKKKSRKTKKLNEIKVYLGDKTLLKDKFDTTFYTVRRALDGYTNSALGYSIRKCAIKDFGGKEIPLVEPEMLDDKNSI